MEELCPWIKDNRFSAAKYKKNNAMRQSLHRKKKGKKENKVFYLQLSLK